MGDKLDVALADFSASVQIASGSRCIAISVYSWSDGPSLRKTGLISYAFYDAADEVLEPREPYSNSAKVGPYFYLSSAAEDGYATTRVDLAIPVGATRCELRGNNWRPGVTTRLYKAPLIRQPGSESESIFEQRGGQAIPIPVRDFLSISHVPRGSTAAIIRSSFSVEATARSSKAFVLVELLDDEGKSMLPTGDLPINPLLGSFIELEGSKGKSRDSKTVSIQLPVDCVQIRFRGSPWSALSVELTEPIDVKYVGSGRRSQLALPEFLKRIPSDTQLIVMYSNLVDIADRSSYSRSKRLAFEYAEAGNWVVHFSPIALAEEEPVSPHEHIYPVGLDKFRLFMDAAMQRQGNNNIFVCSSFTDLNVASSIDRMQDNSWVVVYEVCDDMEEFSKVFGSNWFNHLLEARVAKRSDQVVATSPRLQEKIATIGRRSDVQVIPNAVPDDLATNAIHLRHPKSINKRRNCSKVGYIGSLAPYRFDWDLLIKVARDLPSVDFELIGYEFPSDMILPKNVVYIGSMSYAECIPYAERWRAGLIPFKISGLTYRMDPNQVYEYVAMGLRTISPPIESIQDIPGVWVYYDAAGAVAGVTDAINRENTCGELAEYDEYTRHAKWSDRAKQMLDLLEGGQE